MSPRNFIVITEADHSLECEITEDAKVSSWVMYPGYRWLLAVCIIRQVAFNTVLHRSQGRSWIVDEIGSHGPSNMIILLTEFCTHCSSIIDALGRPAKTKLQ